MYTKGYFFRRGSGCSESDNDRENVVARKEEDIVFAAKKNYWRSLIFKKDEMAAAVFPSISVLFKILLLAKLILG